MADCRRGRTSSDLCAVLALAACTLGLSACNKPSATPAQDPAAPASSLVVRDKQDSDKLNAYVEAYNRLHRRQGLAQTLEQYRAGNPGLRAKGNPPLDRYNAPVDDVDYGLKALDGALALQGSAPELDEPARALKVALDALEPLLKEAQAYDSGKEYLSDKGTKARVMDAPLQAALADAAAKSSALGAALSAQTLKRDEARLASLEPGSVAHHKLKVMLASRKLGAVIKSVLRNQQKPADIVAALNLLSQANAELGTLKRNPAAPPAWDPVCALYKGKVDAVLGATRVLTQALEGGTDAAVSSAASTWFERSNDAVDAANRCGS